jgi:hypothetical protein
MFLKGVASSVKHVARAFKVPFFYDGNTYRQHELTKKGAELAEKLSKED